MVGQIHKPKKKCSNRTNRSCFQWAVYNFAFATINLSIMLTKGIRGSVFAVIPLIALLINIALFVYFLVCAYSGRRQTPKGQNVLGTPQD